jgi:hypothetical protein
MAKEQRQFEGTIDIATRVDNCSLVALAAWWRLGLCNLFAAPNRDYFSNRVDAEGQFERRPSGLNIGFEAS